MERKTRLLVVIQLVRRGGVELVAINFARELDKSKYDVSFLLVAPYEGIDAELLKELESEGFSFISIPENTGGYLAKYGFIDSLFKNEKFDAVHSHVIFFSGIVMAAARKNGIPVRVAHSHITKWNRAENFKYKLYKGVMRSLINRNATHKLACSYDAGCFLYGKSEYEKNGIFVANAIDTDKFSFNVASRKRIRVEFGASDDTTVVGHVGSVYKIKNQKFLVEIFSDMLKSDGNMLLLLVGELFDDEPVKKRAVELNIADKVVFTGPRGDIDSLYSAMDIMIFPSLHEGLPLAVLEAQAAKLPCLISDSVTKEVKFNDNVAFESLASPLSVWSNKAFELLKCNRENTDISKLINSYDIHNAVSVLDDIYNGVI